MTETNEQIEAGDRPDPYTLVFGAEEMDERLFPPIVEESEARDQPLDDPDRFLFLTSVGKLLQAIGGSEPYEQGREVPEEKREALRQYGRLLFHAVQFWRAGSPRYELDEETVRWLLDDVTRVGDWSLTAPASAGYLRLPRNLVWAAPAPNLQPEPADGFFWMLTGGDAPPRRLHVLLALGVRPDRPGFSVVPTTGVLDDVDHWAEADARPDGADFETNLPGGEMDRLYSVENAAELLKLASLCLWELDPASG